MFRQSLVGICHLVQAEGADTRTRHHEPIRIYL